MTKGLSILVKYLYYSLFLIVIAFGLIVRFDDIETWRKNESFYFQNEPIYSEYDSFYFARYALDMKEGLFKNGSIDHFRFYPENRFPEGISPELTFTVKYNLASTFISYFFYKLSQVTGVSVAWLSYYLIPIMAVSVVVPLFFYFNSLGLPLAGILGGLVAVASPMYLGRTGLMRLDHDILNLTLPFTIGLFFYYFFRSENFKAKLFWIILSSITLIFYQLWYAHPNLNFVLVLTFLIAYFWDPLKALIFRKNITFNITKRDLLFLGILLLPQMWYLHAGPISLYKQVKTLVFNIKSPTSADILFKDFPNIFMSISELQKLTFWEALNSATYNKYLGLTGLMGAFLFFIFYLRTSIFFLPFFGIGLLVFFSGARFSMYLSPFIGIGLGFLVHFLFERILPWLGYFKERFKQELSLGLIGFLVFLATLYTQMEALRLLSTPKVEIAHAKGFKWLRENTPKDSVIWTWWDYGYAIQLYARRAVFHDGGSQASPKTYFIARSFATDNPREGWLITSFISNYGLTGIARLLKEGLTPEELLRKIRSGEFSKPLPQPVYWVFTSDLIPKFGWIHYFGSYDFQRKEGIFGEIIMPSYCKIIANNIIQCPELENVVIDLNSGTLSVRNERIPIKEYYFSDGKHLESKKFFDQGYVVEIIRGANNQVGLFLLKPPSDRTLFNEMFLLRKYDPHYFELVYDDFPHVVIYRVKSE
ncbi:MAG: dolichyl-diphosphooligosaccharide--protein glycosyltransferase subunit STT3 [Caldimicrobium sp.]|nr:dolichyl-diphosphooligosaccharide--protein glycosyltransferase subunit STT3 [Caldimicrobium sp.]MCX7872938.1 dolichyl-diphosphooligosaccharide--protein glycosyltransferase subunit STT3 [Caldimicrobium sp.]MDW8094460.1 STT3 domain-containing protein [Caldimicrobium sp.]